MDEKSKSYEEKISKTNMELLILKSENARLKDRLTELEEENELLSGYYSEIVNSFYWRILSPMRKITHKLKLLIFKSKFLTKICRGIKMCLLSGPKAVYRKLKKLGKKYRVRIKIKNDISKKRRAEEAEFKFKKDIKFSILVPLYNTPKNYLEEMISSVLNQTYGNFELCLADGSDDNHGYVGEYCNQIAGKDSRIKYKKLKENLGISENTNACIDMSTGDYIALFDHDDLLHSSVLFEYMKVICNKNADFIYCDEDKFEFAGKKAFDPFFKPDFAPDNLRANNYICHFTVFSRELLDKVGKFRKEFDGSQDHDMVLRLTEQAKCIVHIPKVLYHWRVSKASVASDPYAKPYTITAGINAVSEHLERVGLKGTVESSDIHPNIYRIRYELKSQPLVSIVIPNYNHVEELSRCIYSIVSKSTYKNYEIIIVENNSSKETFDFYETLKVYPQVKVVVYKPEIPEFNYSAINNYGVKFCSGDYYILLNNDVEIITPDWIQEMLMFAQRDDMGAVGAMLYYPDDTIQHAGVVLGVLTLAGHMFKHFPRGSVGYFGNLGYQRNITAVTAACVMIPKSVYEKIGGLDETFKVAFNDIDMCMRIREAGYLIAVTPYCELYHYESISRGVEDTASKKARFKGEITRFKRRWKKELKEGDPYYNPNLSLENENFEIK